jgi:hypothetical protein
MDDTRSALMVMIEEAKEPGDLVVVANDVATLKGDTEELRSAIRARAEAWPANKLKPGDLVVLKEAGRLAHSNRATVHSVAGLRLPPINR